MVQWLRLFAPNAGGPGSIPGQGTRSHAAAKNWHSQRNNFFKNLERCASRGEKKKVSIERSFKEQRTIHNISTSKEYTECVN